MAFTDLVFQIKKSGDFIDFMAEIANKLDDAITENPQLKSLMVERIEKIITEAEKHGEYLKGEYQKASKNGFANRDKKPAGRKWYRYSTSGTSGRSDTSYYFDKGMPVFWMKDEPKPNPLEYLFRIIQNLSGELHEGLDDDDYKCFLLACIHDTQRIAAGQKRIYFDPKHIFKDNKELKNRVCRTVWNHLAECDYHPVSRLQDMAQTIKNALSAVQTASGGKAGDTTQATPETTKQKAKSVRDLVFIGYSHKDKKWLNDLQTHLKPYVRNGSVTAWSDKQIAPGSKWFPEIKAALASTKVAVLLVTPDFLASDFIHEHELGPILKETENGKVSILWIPVRACSYKETPLKDYQAAIEPDKPLANMKAERDRAWVLICEEIKKTVLKKINSA